MSTLRVNPFPTPAGDAGSPALQKEWEGGFVDEAVIAAMLARPYVKRSAPQPEDLALSAEDLDFAGWSVPATAPLRDTRETPAPQQPVNVSVPCESPLPTAASEEEPPKRGNHLWWLAGTALALSAIFFCSVLPSFLAGSGAPSVEKGTPPGQAKTSPVAASPSPVGSNGEGSAPQP